MPTCLAADSEARCRAGFTCRQNRGRHGSLINALPVKFRTIIRIIKRFMARRRHVDALLPGKRNTVEQAKKVSTSRSGELIAEDLRAAQNALNEITGEFTSEDLLGRIFSRASASANKFVFANSLDRIFIITETRSDQPNRSFSTARRITDSTTGNARKTDTPTARQEAAAFGAS